MLLFQACPDQKLSLSRSETVQIRVVHCTYRTVNDKHDKCDDIARLLTDEEIQVNFAIAVIKMNQKMDEIQAAFIFTHKATTSSTAGASALGEKEQEHGPSAGGVPHSL